MSDQFTSVQWDRDEDKKQEEQVVDHVSVEEPIVEAEEEGDSESPLAQQDLTHLKTKTSLSTDHDHRETSDNTDTDEDNNTLEGREEDEDSDNDDETGSGLLPIDALGGSFKEIKTTTSPVETVLESTVGDNAQNLQTKQTLPVPFTSQNTLQDTEVQIHGDESETTTTENKDYFIETYVSTPITEYDGQNPFTSFLIQIKTDCAKFKKKTFQIRRRYSDFHFIYECLSNDYPTVVIPPLPNKQRLEYIKGGRFTDEFTNKRAISLNNFLNRVCKHPILKQSQIFHIFLEDSDYWITYKSNLKITSNNLDTSNSTAQNLETVTDYIMNSFKKPSYESIHKREFQDIQEKSTKLQENLNRIDHIYTKVLNKQHDISDDFSRFSEEFSKLNILLTNDIAGKSRPAAKQDANSTLVSNQFSKFSSNLNKMSEGMHLLNHEIEYNYLTSLKDLEHYIAQLKSLIKLKETKSIDYEMLSSYLDKAKQEREYLISGGSVTSSAEGTISFLTRKLESMAGLGSAHQHGNLTNERIEKLNSRIQMLEKEKKLAFEVFEKFEDDILEEYQFFEKIKNEEVNESLKGLCDSYLEYYTNLVNDWKSLEFPASELNIANNVFKNKLFEDDEHFSNNDVLKNNELLNENLAKIQSLKH